MGAQHGSSNTGAKIQRVGAAAAEPAPPPGRKNRVGMSAYSNDFDVTDRVRTTDPVAVNREIDRIFLELYPRAATQLLDQAFTDAESMYSGALPGYIGCNTPYHDIQHVLDVTLAMARLIDGYERSRVGGVVLGKDLFELGVITALFHDCGYICRDDEERQRNGAEFTVIHVSRGATFLRDYLKRAGRPQMAEIAADLIHFTGYERRVDSIPVPDANHRLLGNLLGSADIIAQMSDRCYLEKCRDRLYPEFVTGGLAEKKLADGNRELVFASGEDLLRKTPGFYAGATRRLNEDLAGGFTYAEQHFGGQNLYIEAVEKNIRFVDRVKAEGAEVLKRHPPNTLPE
jgi:hypothetical protein